MKRIAGSLTALVLAAAVPAAGQAASPPLLIPSAVSNHPTQSFVLALPGPSPASAAAVKLRENDKEIKGMTLVSAASVPAAFGSMLVLNASSDVPKAAIDRQMVAARAFAARRDPRQPLGIVSYNNAATILTQPTTDQQTIEDALRLSPPRKAGSKVYAATVTALDMLRASRVGAGTVVTFAGGLDDAGEDPPKSLGQLARKGNARVLVLGLGSRDAASRVLTGFRSTKVAFAYGTPARPETILTPLARQLRGAVLLQYRTEKKAGESVDLKVEAGGVRVRTPAFITQAAPGADAADDKPFFKTTFGRLLLSTFVIAVLFGGFAPLLLLRRRGNIQRRVADYAGQSPDLDEDFEFLGPRDEVEAARPIAKRIIALTEILELARIDVPAGQLIGVTVGAALLAALIFGAIFGTPLVGLFVLVAVPLVVRGVVRARLAHQRKLFAGQLADQLQAMAAALRSGHSFVGAISGLVDDAPEPSKTEYNRLVSDERLGVPLEDAFAEMIDRMDNRDLEQVAMVAMLQRETGGNGAESLDRVVEGLRARDEVQRLVNTLTAQGRMSRWVLTAIPIALGAALTASSPDYMEPLFSTSTGRAMLIFAALMVTAGSLAIKKVVEIRV